MTASVLQELTNENVNIAATTITRAITYTAASTAVVFSTVDAGGGGTTISISDTGGAYTKLREQLDVANGQFSALWAKSNVAGGATTVTATFDSSRLARGIWVVEVGGVATSAIDGHNVNEQLTPGTATDGITVTATNIATPGIIIAFSFRVGGGAAPAAGTGFASTTTAFNFTTSNQARSENLRTTTGTSQTATFTAGANVSHDTFAVFLDEIGATGGSVSDIIWSAAERARRNTLLRM